MNATTPSLPKPSVDAALPRQTLLGWGALMLTLIVWAGFALSMRAIGASALTRGDVALVRFLVPALAMLPFMPSRLAALRRLSLEHWLMIAGGAGLPFFALTAAGGRLTSAAHVSALVAGTAPLSFALLGWLLWREPVARARKVGLAVILAGVALLVAGLGGLQADAFCGVALLLVASGCWGLYTHGLRKSGLDPLGCVMAVSVPSLLVLLPLMFSGLVESHLGQVAGRDLLPFVLVQGLGAGLLSTLVYALSIRLLGPLRCASVGALAPVLVTVLAVPVLGEQPPLVACCGVLVVTAGVLLSNRPTRG